MAKRNTADGICIYCSESYSSQAMTRHLESCEKRKNFYLTKNKKNKSHSNNIVFLLKVVSKYYPEYWMYLEVDGTAKLKAIDKFLRDTWLECCGHEYVHYQR